jgi:Fis family transcriptional regulator
MSTENASSPVNPPVPPSIPLNGHVRAAVEDYFSRLEGHGVTNLYELVLREIESPLLQTVLEHCAHNQTKAAQILGLSRSTLRKKMTRYGIL